MPRPGPRPYECVRRAWHSDRHQPIRGSLIQEIFRIVNEIHSSATKKNKEWQEKLPLVVLKAEEIMYSKANSEAEYVNVNTLRDRANDAINTIIRRDESTETGDLLQPCIEAALHLGCTPRRSSRSQRNNNPSCYLNPEKPQPSIPLSNLDTRKVLGLPFSPRTPFSNDNHQFLPPRQAHSLSSSCSVYPLYYGDKFELEDSSSFKASCKPNYSLMKDDDKIGVMEKQSSSSSVVMISQDISETPPRNECDLSLRLGPLKVGSMSSGLLPSKNDHQDLYLLSKDNAHDMLDCSSSTKWKSKTQNLNAEGPSRKRKVDVCSHSSDDRQFCLPLKVQLKQFNGRINNAYQ